MARHLDGIGAFLLEPQRIFHRGHAFGHELARPAVTQHAEGIPVRAAAALGSVEVVTRHAEVRHPGLAGHQLAQRPSRVQRKVEKLLGPDAKRDLEAVALVARTAHHFRHVQCEHEVLVARSVGPVDQLQGLGAIAAVVELEPGMTLGHGNELLQRRRRQGGHAQGNPVLRRQGCEQPVRIGRCQVAHRHRARAEGQTGGAAQQWNRQVALGHIAQHPGLQPNVGQCGQVQGLAMTGAGSSVDVIEHQAWQASLRQSPGIFIPVDHHGRQNLCGMVTVSPARWGFRAPLKPVQLEWRTPAESWVRR